jgi:hypothetical protein
LNEANITAENIGSSFKNDEITQNDSKKAKPVPKRKSTRNKGNFLIHLHLYK